MCTLTVYKNINFVPENILLSRKKKVKKTFFLLVAVAIVILFIWPYSYLYFINSSADKKIVKLQMMKMEYQSLADTVTDIRNKKEKINNDIVLLRDVEENRKAWKPVLDLLCASVPGQMWFTSLDLGPSIKDGEAADQEGNTDAANTTQAALASGNQDNLISITGMADSVETVGRFLYKLNSEQRFDRIMLENMGRVGNDVEFTITIQVNDI